MSKIFPCRSETKPASLISGSLGKVLKWMLLGLLLTSPLASAETNLLPNGGFELGNASGWTTWGSTIAATNTLKRTGNYAGLVTNRTADWQTAVVNALPLVTPGKTYRFSAWLQLAPGADSNLSLVVATTDGTGRKFTTLQTVPGKSGSWTKVSGEFLYAPSGPSTELSIYFACADAVRNLYIDDAELVLVNNVLSNPGFERGNVDGWTAVGCSLTATTAEKHSGDYSALVSGRTAAWNGPWRTGLQTVLTSGKSYRASVWIKPSPGPDITVQLTTKQTSGGVDSYGPVLQQKVCSAGEWTELSGGFLFLNPGNTTDMNLYIYCVDPTRDYYIDDGEIRLDELTVNLNEGGAAVSQKATGFLHGLSDQLPATGSYEVLKPRIQRSPAFLGNPNMLPYTPPGESGQSGFSSPAYMNRLKAANVKQQVLLSDEYMWFGLHQSWGWPGDAAHNGKTSFQLLDEKIDALLDAAMTDYPASEGWQIEWDLWNEPDQAEFWGRDQAQFFQTWKHAYERVRAKDPAAKIVGPSIAYFVTQGSNPTRAGWLKEFLIFAKDNNVLPDIVSWHEMLNPKEIPGQVEAVRAFMAANGIADRPIDVNEYQGPGIDLMQSPGNTVRFLSNLEGTDIRYAIRACWNEDANQSDGSTNGLAPGRLDNIMTTYPFQPRALWQVYKSYAEMSGQMVPMAPGGFLTGLASVDATNGYVRILVGNDGTNEFTSKVTINKISSLGSQLPFGQVRVRVREIPFAGLNALTAPTAISDALMTPADDSLEIPLPMTSRGVIEITLETRTKATGLTARAGDGRVVLNWNPKLGATGYYLKTGLSSGGPFVLREALGASDVYYADTNLLNGTTYYYVVSALGEGGSEGSDSNEASATPTGPSAPAAAPELLSAVSRRSHGSAGTFDLPIAIVASTSAGVEPRSGDSLTLVATFDKNVVSGTASVAVGTASPGSASFSGTTMTIPLSGVANAQTLQVNLSDVVAEDGGTLPSGVLSLRVLRGDVNGNGSVSGSDVNTVKAAVGSTPDSTRFTTDVNASGSVSGADVNITKAAVGSSVP